MYWLNPFNWLREILEIILDSVADWRCRRFGHLRSVPLSSGLEDPTPFSPSGLNLCHRCVHVWDARSGKVVY